MPKSPPFETLRGYHRNSASYMITAVIRWDERPIKTVATQVTDAMEKLEKALPESLSGNEVATDAWKTAATPAVI